MWRERERKKDTDYYYLTSYSEKIWTVVTHPLIINRQYNKTECNFKTVNMLGMSTVIKKMGRCSNKHDCALDRKAI